MRWPSAQDYNEAIQNPRTSFGCPELREGSAVCNGMGVPLPRSGNFADVYEFIGASGTKWAIKCFTRKVAGDLQERYAAISKHLGAANLAFTVDCDYLGRGLRVQEQCYPMLKMTWVEGKLLNQFLSEHLDHPSLLESLLTLWKRMVERLRDAHIVHGDLQHGNIILTATAGGSRAAIKLVDYDGMWVPALADTQSGEVGHPNYQHPQRSESSVYGPDMDRLPMLVIACALRALAFGGRALWDRYDNGDNLLFCEADLREPTQSPLIRELWNTRDNLTHNLVGWLVFGLSFPLEKTPHLADIAIDPQAPRLEPDHYAAAVLWGSLPSAPPIPSGLGGVPSSDPPNATPPQHAAAAQVATLKGQSRRDFGDGGRYVLPPKGGARRGRWMRWVLIGEVLLIVGLLVTISALLIHAH